MKTSFFEMPFSLDGQDRYCSFYTKSDETGHYIEMHVESGEVYELRPDPGNLEAAYSFVSPNVPQDLQEQIMAISDVILEYRSLAAAQAQADERELPATG